MIVTVTAKIKIKPTDSQMEALHQTMTVSWAFHQLRNMVEYKAQLADRSRLRLIRSTPRKRVRNATIRQKKTGIKGIIFSVAGTADMQAMMTA